MDQKPVGPGQYFRQTNPHGRAANFHTSGSKRELFTQNRHSLGPGYYDLPDPNDPQPLKKPPPNSSPFIKKTIRNIN